MPVLLSIDTVRDVENKERNMPRKRREQIVGLELGGLAGMVLCVLRPVTGMSKSGSVEVAYAGRRASVAIQFELRGRSCCA